MKQENEWFIIDDLQKFVESTRIIVYDSFGNQNEKSADELSIIISDLSDDQKDELQQMLSQKECMVIAQNFIKKRVNKKTGKTRFVISTNDYMKMIESFNSRMISNMLSGLVNKGIIESAYDEKINDFIFWVKDDKNDYDKPETD